MTKVLTRRNFLLAGVATVLAVEAGVNWYLTKPNEVNKLLRDFPTEIPGARKIAKHEIRGASKCLVHVLQTHLTEGIEEGSDDWKEISQVQTDIYQILDHFYAQHNLKSVYVEGFTPESIDLRYSHRNLLRVARKGQAAMEEFDKKRIVSLEEELGNERTLNLGAYLRFSGDTNSLEKYKAELSQELADLKKREYNTEIAPPVINGAAEKMFCEGKIKIIPVETLRANVEAGMLADDVRNGIKVYVDEFNKKAMQQREDIALEMISKSPDQICFLVYGAGHYFGDNINEWNLQHPNNKYSLIEITPESYK